MIENAFENLSIAAKSNHRIEGYTHNFYKYPARFSPKFARESILLFSETGDLVLDPFVGGGTTIIEASVLGRKSVGIDINSLATFVTKVKTTLLNEQQFLIIRDWINKLNTIKLRPFEIENSYWENQGYLKNLSDKHTWRIRNQMGLILNSLGDIADPDVSDFIRCALLRTGQWALDGKSSIPTLEDFRNRLRSNLEKMILELTDYATESDRYFSEFSQEYLTIINRSSIGLEEEKIFNTQSPKLILMSPPYPGIHILYHRWQVRSRRETSAPYWIADKLDGNGESHYTIGSRLTHQKQEYFIEMGRVFNSLAKISNKETTIIQLISFSDPDKQLPLYLTMMNKSGFKEVFLPTQKNHERIWRDVPNRKWYTKIQECRFSSKEVVLIHRKFES